MADAPSLEPLADGSGFRVRVRCGKARNRYRIPSTDHDFAEQRASVLVELGQLLATQPAGLAHQTLTDAAVADGPALARIRQGVNQLLSKAPAVKQISANPRSLWTVKELGEAWTNGTLAKEYPDQIRVRRSADDDISRLTQHVYPVLGAVRVRDVKLADLERVMASLEGKRPSQRKLSALTRRNVALTLNRLLAIAVYPLKLIASNPVPRGFVPKGGARRALAYLYPDEDARLLACDSIPIRERLFWGFLAREGCRVSEALGLRWEDFDLERGAVRLDKNKTDDPRAWALSPGVAVALAPFQGEPGELVFEPPADPLSMAELLRSRLDEAGITRTELFKATPERMALRAHDLRGSFVTIAFANGRSEAWVSDRTGHRSSQMLSRYKRQARTAAELNLGDWLPLDAALGLASDGTASGTDWSRLRDLNSRPAVYETCPTARRTAQQNTS